MVPIANLLVGSKNKAGVDSQLIIFAKCKIQAVLGYVRVGRFYLNLAVHLVHISFKNKTKCVIFLNGF